MSEPATILIVDDDPFNRDILVQKLEGLGYRPIEARNGREALERVAQGAPSLVILDVLMPVMDGFETCRRLKSDDRTQLVHVVMMTALHAIDDRVRGFEAGADEFLTKPVDDRELQARIRAALRARRAVDAALRQVVQVRDHYAKFVPDVVRRLVAANPAAPELEKREQDAAYLFADISGYTALSATMPADALSRLVERYFSAFLDRIRAFEGDISSTAGDGLLAIFHQADPAGHSRKAAETALALMAATAELNAAGDGPPIAVHIGLSSGTAAVGSTKFEGLRDVRWVYTAEGFVANLGARLAGLAKAGEILVCPESARRLAGRFSLTPLGPQRLRSVTDLVEVSRLDRGI
ncbi:MAG: response regulator [Dongiaceae bacterium]